MVLKPADTVLILNGGSSAGKTTLARAIQSIMPSPYIQLGIDTFWLAIPDKELNFETVDPQYYRWGYEEHDGQNLFRITPGPYLDAAMNARYYACVEFLKRGFNIVADEVFWKSEWLFDAAKALDGFKTYLIGVYVDDEIGREREEARGDRFPGWAKGSQFFAHKGMSYDLTVNTSRKSPGECALEIKNAIDNGLRPQALELLTSGSAVPEQSKK